MVLDSNTTFSPNTTSFFPAKHEAKPSEFLNLTYIKILLENTSVTACQTPRNCFPTPRNNFCSVSAKIQIPPLRSEMFAIIRDVISQWLLRISQCMNICSKWVFEKSSQQNYYTTVVTHFKCSQHPNTTKKKMKSFPLFNIMMQTQQDHQWWRYHRRLFDYQSPYF